MAGIASGATEGLVLAPFERVKVYMQVQRTQASQVMCTVVIVSNIIAENLVGYVPIIVLACGITCKCTHVRPFVNNCCV